MNVNNELQVYYDIEVIDMFFKNDIIYSHA